MATSDGSDELHQREEDPQGLLYFTRYDSVPIMVEALFGSSTSREFTITELASKADLSPRSVSQRIDVLYDLGVIESIEDTNRFSLNLDGEITWKLRELDGLIKEAQSSDKFPLKTQEKNESQEEIQSDLIRNAGNEAVGVMEEVRKQASGMKLHAD